MPTASADVSLRYSDLPQSVELNVPTPEGFAAMKLMAWHQRQAPRDLVDLAALAAAGAITSMTLDLTKHVTGTRLGARTLDQRLTPAVFQEWRHQLAHRMTEPPDPGDCLQQVVDAARQADRL